jgi:DNA-binding beta-propeller fold protein YncE
MPSAIYTSSHAGLRDAKNEPLAHGLNETASGPGGYLPVREWHRAVGRLGIGALFVAWSAAASGPLPSPSEQSSASKTHAIALLGANGSGRVSMDYIGYDEATNNVWVPGGNTGKVFVIDAKTESLRSVDAFPVREADGRVLGPSSVAFGPDSAFIGNRADSTVCSVNKSSLQRRGCITLASTPDGLAYVASRHEVWATTPRTHSIALLEVTDGAFGKSRQIELDGQPEGYAVDTRRGLFFTSLEDKDETLAIDVTSHAIKARWKTGCGDDGPRGMALDSESGLLFIACSSSVVAFALDRDRALAGRGVTGQGLDNPAIVVGLKRVYAAAGKAGTLSILAYSPEGALSVLSTLKTAEGVRVVTVDRLGKAFAADSAGGRIWVLGP